MCTYYMVIVQQVSYRTLEWYICVDKQANPYEQTPKLLDLASATSLLVTLQKLYPGVMYKLIEVLITEES